VKDFKKQIVRKEEIKQI